MWTTGLIISSRSPNDLQKTTTSWWSVKGRFFWHERNIFAPIFNKINFRKHHITKFILWTRYYHSNFIEINLVDQKKPSPLPWLSTGRCLSISGPEFRLHDFHVHFWYAVAFNVTSTDTLDYWDCAMDSVNAHPDTFCFTKVIESTHVKQVPVCGDIF